MRKRVRNEPDSGPAAEGAMVTYSRLPRGGRGPAEPREPVEPREPFERQEPFIEARQVPHRDDDLRAYDPDRAAIGLDGAVDDLEAPRRGRKRRRGGFAPVLIGAVALAAGMVILAYAYGVATRVDEPSPLSAGASLGAPESAAGTRGTLSGDDAARSIPVKGDAPPASAASGSDGTPMDGDVAQPSGGARPALVAPVPATATPAQPGKPATRPAATARAEPPAAKTGSAPANNAKPADNADNLMANIERLLQRDGATAGASGQPGDSPAASAGPAPPVAAQPAAVADPNALPLLPDPNAVATTPPVDVAPPTDNRLIPPADIPNVAPSNTGLNALH